MEKIKQFFTGGWGKDVLIVIIVILVSLGSFELGRLSRSTESSSGIKIQYQEQTTPAGDANVVTAVKSISDAPKILKSSSPAEKSYFASNRGSKYYPVGCAAGKTLKLENRVYFKTSAEAEAAGYTLSSSCK